MAGIAALVARGRRTPTAAEVFYKEAFELGDALRVRESQAPTTGFRGFTLSLVVSQPSTVDSLVRTRARRRRHRGEAGQEELLGLRRRRAGAGRDDLEGRLLVEEGHRPGHPEVDEVVLLLGVEDVKATKQFYVDRGLAVGKSFGSKYVEFDTPGSAVKLALYRRKAAAKDAGVDPEGSGSHRLVVSGDAGAFTDPDGFVWEAADGRRRLADRP